MLILTYVAVDVDVFSDDVHVRIFELTSPRIYVVLLDFSQYVVLVVRTYLPAYFAKISYTA